MILRELLFIANIITCVCYQEKTFMKESSYSDKICLDENTDIQAITRSVISCAGQCMVWEGCNSFVYHKSSGTCFEMNPANSCSVFGNLQGANYYRLISSYTGCTSSAALLPALGDAQISASSYRSKSNRAYHARLNKMSNWAAEFNVRNFYIQGYIQVDFGSMWVVTAVILQGACCEDEWVTTYNVMTSRNCYLFKAIRDEMERVKVFTGNTDRNTHSTAVLDPVVSTRCFRIYPSTWEVWPSLRFELLGCLL